MKLTIKIGDMTIHRIGFGTMRLTGPGIFGPPENIDGCRAALRALPELGVDFIDTSWAYGPGIAEALVKECLHPYKGMVVATKGGLVRPGPGEWARDGRPEALRTAVQISMKLLGVDRIDLWQLHRPDDKVPLGEQFDCIAQMQKEGLIHHAGLSNVSVQEIETARKYFQVASVQNRYYVIDRGYEDVVDHCERQRIPFIAYFPLAFGGLARPNSILQHVAARLGIPPAQAALAWLLKRSKNIIVIPGTTRADHARENCGAENVTLSDADYAEIERIGQRAAKMKGVAQQQE